VARYLGVDFGERAIGLAICDDDAGLVVPIEPVTRSSDAQAVAALLEIAGREAVVGIVVGEPRRLDGSAGDAAQRAGSFAEKLSAATRIPVVLHDEALTSHEAASRLRRVDRPDAAASGGSRRAGSSSRRRRGSAAIHSVAAQVLLEDWLTRRRS